MIELTLVQAILAAAGFAMAGVFLMAIINAIFDSQYDKKNQNENW